MRNILSSLLLLCFSAFGQTPTAGTVTKVTDGDTLFVSGAKRVKVRLAYIDAPELKQTYGIEAKRYLDNFLNKKVEIETITKDRYGRTIAVIYHNNKNINLSIVRKGYGWVYTRYLPKKPDLRKKYTSAESLARKKKLGLWGGKIIIAPWEWRRKNF